MKIFVQSTCEHSDDVAAYALGALPPDQARALGRHLESCSDCAAELAHLLPAVDALPLTAVQQQVPAGLKRDVMAAVRADARKRAGAPVARRPALAGWLTVRPAFAGAGALACAALAVVLVLVLTGGSNVRTYRGTVSYPGASATLRVDSGHRELTVSRMPQPPQGKVYEVWIEKAGGTPIATKSLFGVTRTGAGKVAVPDLHGVKAVLVTAEPAGGSQTPTSKPVIAAKL